MSETNPPPVPGFPADPSLSEKEIAVITAAAVQALRALRGIPSSLRQPDPAAATAAPSVPEPIPPRRGRGRPPSDASRTRHRIGVRLSPREFSTVSQAAEIQERNLADFARLAILEEAERVLFAAARSTNPAEPDRPTPGVTK
jgi:hypothetical protein